MPTPSLPGAGDLRPEHIEAVFLEFLGRRASPGDVAIWMGVGSLRAFIDGVLTSEEYASRVAERAAVQDVPDYGPYLNCWVPGLEQFARPVGTLSPDGVAIVGRDGHLFLYGGSNDNLAMYRGEIPMAGDWTVQWRDLVDERSQFASERGLGLACLVVPDKLAVYEDHFPQDLSSGPPRPVMRLIHDAGLPLLYPIDVLRDAREGGDTYLRTDSHLTARGNRLLAEAAIEGLGASSRLLDGVGIEARVRLASGDLGQHFRPPIVEAGSHLVEGSRAAIVTDNWGEVSAVGGHIGTLRVFRYDDAQDGRTVVVFGDSYGFGDAAYQGLSWFLAQAFREVHFVWTPFGWDPGYVERAGAELVVCQTAERFIARVPRRQIDVQSLARETIGRRSGIGLEQIFADVSAP